jgi:glycosyltransferase involved in cell wall biosynthesis
MACGCPVITTASGSLAEVAGDAAIFVQPDSIQELLAAIEQVQRPEVREGMIARGFEQAKRFSWSHTAQQIREVLEKIAREAKRA